MNFEKIGIDFKSHKNYDHSIWTYVNFLTYMKNKTSKDCNGLENEVLEKIESGDTSWFPTGITLSLSLNFYDKIFILIFNY